MLRSLSIHNFALIKKTEIIFREGLNILSGETGAGKSILIDALNLVLGSRAYVESIRHGADAFRIEAVFEIEEDSAVSRFLGERGIETEEDGTLILVRSFTTAGKNRITVNDHTVTLKVLKQLAEYLVDMHGQHENQSLMRPEVQLALVDRYSPECEAALAEYREKYRVWREASAELARLSELEQELQQRLDMLKWQIKEIEDAHLKEGEEEQLAQEIKLMSSAEKISGSLQTCYRLFQGGGRGSAGILSQLSEVQKELESVSRYEESFAQHIETVTEALCQLEECARDVVDFGEQLVFDEKRMDQMQRRMDLLYKLRKKYGATIEAVLTYYKEAKAELDEIECRDERIAEWTKKVVAAAKAMQERAAQLTTCRKASAAKLSEKIRYHLAQLGMPSIALDFVIEEEDNYHTSGNDRIVILFSSNLGQKPQPIQKVASGGEISRFAIALKAIGGWKEEIETMVFDEIDTGIGGATAQMVAERIAVIAARRQVLCITHLPQIACYADVHLYVAKEETGGETVTRVKKLDGSDRTEELARLTAGSITKLSLEHAQEMMREAGAKKRELQAE